MVPKSQSTISHESPDSFSFLPLDPVSPLNDWFADHDAKAEGPHSGKANGVEKFRGKVERTLKFLLKTTAGRGDPELGSSPEVVIAE